jgi:hypothetical protein
MISTLTGKCRDTANENRKPPYNWGGFSISTISSIINNISIFERLGIIICVILFSDNMT